MSKFNLFINDIENEAHREKLRHLFEWIETQYSDLTPVVKWNQPMYTYNETFIIAFSKAKQHFSIMPEAACLKQFKRRVLTLVTHKLKIYLESNGTKRLIMI